MNKVDLRSSIDVESRLDRAQARKILAKILKSDPNFLAFSRHSRLQMIARGLSSLDVINVLKAGKILSEPEEKKRNLAL